ncbi:hypothetical protein [Paraburkholderia acidisoli]|uniref:Uncharacterized protein n=1 Tax=Paraburkholderia acidisoli TaxID=2571748 RepID=A0A7Z2JG92_9BURK|nr:hypothetical protein [Paraburkholderia acidisoli]QGZ64312.1 hypothetical protein FAZ98_21565 [Paraburkholderia acidisoli]
MNGKSGQYRRRFGASQTINCRAEHAFFAYSPRGFRYGVFAPRRFEIDRRTVARDHPKTRFGMGWITLDPIPHSIVWLKRSLPKPAKHVAQPLQIADTAIEWNRTPV